MRERMKSRVVVWVIFGILAIGAVVLRHRLEAAWSMGKAKLEGKKTVAERLEQYGPAARGRWRTYLKGMAYPPARVVLLGLKSEKVLQVYVAAKDQPLQLLRAMPILAASGKLGPKLKEGDRQVPEGIYGIDSLNPNSSFHLALRVSYPNQQDREWARLDGRTQLGGDIMIHGNAVSIGCLAMGNEGAEDLFVLAADTGLKNVTVLLSPVDFRKEEASLAANTQPSWTKDLYSQLAARLKELPITQN